jgi:hypothetical protein
LTEEFYRPNLKLLKRREKEMKKVIKKYVRDLDIDGLTLLEAVSYLDNLRKTYGDDIRVDSCLRYDGDTEFELAYTAEETDEEYSVRLRHEAYAKAERRRQFEAMKAEFEGDDK